MADPVVHDEGPLRWITLDRPETLNALVPEDLTLIADAVREPPGAVRAIVVTGSGDRAFCSGMHKAVFVGASPSEARAIISVLADCLAAVRTSPVPTIAMVNGHCLGAGFELALSCDFRVASHTATFGLPEVLLGIPSVADAALLRHHVGLSMAKEMILTGDLYLATDLAPFGLVNRFAADHGLRAETLRLTEKLTGLTREVVVAQKSLFETWMNHGLTDSVATSIDVFANMFHSPATLQALAQYNEDASD